MTIHNLRAKAFKENLLPSQVSGEVYDVTAAIQTVATPAITPDGGTFESSVSVSIACSTPGAEIRYTVGGGDPSQENGILYTGPFTITLEQYALVGGTVRARASRDGMNESATASSVFTITEAEPPPPPPPDKVATPTITPNGGTFESSVSVTLACATEGATIAYTLNAGSPITYTGPFTLTVDTTVRAQGTKEGLQGSDLAIASFDITAPPPPDPGEEFTVPLSIDSTGTVDVTEDLFDFLYNTVPDDNAIINFQPNGIYKCEWPLQIYAKSNWTINGNNAVILSEEPGLSPAQLYETVGDGVTMQWDVGAVEFGGPAPTVRVNGVNQGTVRGVQHLNNHNANYYYEPSTATIFQDTNLPPLTASDTLSVTYYYSTLAQPPSSINPMGAQYTFQWPLGRQHLHFFYCHDLVIRDLRVIGSKPLEAGYTARFEGQHAWEFQACWNVELDNCGCDGVWGDALGLRPGTYSQEPGMQHWCYNFWIHGGSYNNCARQGFVPISVQHALIEDLAISNIARSGVDYEPFTGLVYPRAGMLDVTFRRITFSNIKNWPCTIGGWSDAVDRIVFEECTGDPFKVLARVGGLVFHPSIPPSEEDPDGTPNWRDLGVRGSLTVRNCSSVGQGGVGALGVSAPGMRVLIVEDNNFDFLVNGYAACAPPSFIDGDGVPTETSDLFSCTGNTGANMIDQVRPNPCGQDVGGNELDVFWKLEIAENAPVLPPYPLPV